MGRTKRSRFSDDGHSELLWQIVLSELAVFLTPFLHGLTSFRLVELFETMESNC